MLLLVDDAIISSECSLTLSMSRSVMQDDLTERLGGVDKVAEMSGRNKRMVAGADGRYRHLSRATDVPLDMVRL